jgi:hypothetical protein
MPDDHFNKIMKTPDENPIERQFSLLELLDCMDDETRRISNLRFQGYSMSEIADRFLLHATAYLFDTAEACCRLRRNSGTARNNALREFDPVYAARRSRAATGEGGNPAPQLARISRAP